MTSKSARESGTPMRPAIARRCTTAFVEPPIAASDTIAFSNDSRTRILSMVLQAEVTMNSFFECSEVRHTKRANDSQVRLDHLDDTPSDVVCHSVTARINRRDGSVAR